MSDTSVQRILNILVTSDPSVLNTWCANKYKNDKNFSLQSGQTCTVVKDINPKYPKGTVFKATKISFDITTPNINKANLQTIQYVVKQMKPDVSSIQTISKIIDGSSVIISGVVYTFDDMKKFGMVYQTDTPIITIDLQGAPSPFPANSAQPVLASTPPPPANSASPVLASTPPPPVSGPTGLTSTFGAMKDDTTSTFGSMASGFLIFIVLLLIVGGVLYYLHSKGKVKIPGLPQRIAAFGRQIKAIRKM
jgi:hypothetical protein